MPQFWLREFASYRAEGRVSSSKQATARLVVDRPKPEGRGACLKSVQLDVGISMREPLDHALHDLFGPIVIPADPVAQVDDSSPILGGEVLVGRLGYALKAAVRDAFSERKEDVDTAARVCDIPTASS